MSRLKGSGTFTYVSLFSGGMGLDLGQNRAGCFRLLAWRLRRRRRSLSQSNLTVIVNVLGKQMSWFSLATFASSIQSSFSIVSD